MEPPRMPLHPINRQKTHITPPPTKKPLHDAKTDSTAPMKPPKIHRHVSSDLMEEFKAVVQGNDLTKLGLLEILKKKYGLPHPFEISFLFGLVKEFFDIDD